MKRAIANTLNHLLDSRLGIRIQRSPSFRLTQVRNRILLEKDIKLVFDVGANRGQWALDLLKSGYKESLVSFEPTEEFTKLQDATNKFPNWKCEKFALAESSGLRSMYQASNGNLSSSLLEPAKIKEMGFDFTFNLGAHVQTITLDDYLKERETVPYYLKLDVQGAEMLVLRGAEKTLKYCLAIEFESAIVELYSKEHSHYEIASWLWHHDFRPLQLVLTHWNVEMETVSLDSIFIRNR